MDARSVAVVCKIHGLIIAEVLRRMGARGIRLERIQFLVDDAGEEFLVCDQRGYHLVKEIGEDGAFRMHAVPGHFGSSAALRWWRDDPRDAILYAGERNGGG